LELSARQINPKGNYMSLVELHTVPELCAHYKAVRARLWSATPNTPAPQPERLFYYSANQSVPIESPAPEPGPTVAAKWREIDERLFGMRVSPKAAICVTADYFGIPVDVICGRCRKGNIASARQIAIYIMHALCRQVRERGRVIEPVRFSFLQIGRHFHVDHSTAYLSTQRAKRRMAENEEYAASISEITELLRRSEKK
jgi:hypothetical protein